MQAIRHTITTALILIFCQFNFPVFGQMGFSLNIKKPKEYEERTLRSEQENPKKFTVPRRFIQNMVTHYNYFFNANAKLNEVISNAKTQHKDDYTQLLSFYNYSLDKTLADSLQIDSIVSKSQTGIALHDLRNDWIDNLYLLWGAAYYLRQEFDSAYLMFQYINYAFAVKEKDGYYKTIGSSRDGNAAYSISTKEKTSLPRKIFSEPPSRNDAFIWQIRTFLAQDLFAEAASLIVTLRNDPVFPKRLRNDLEEVQAYWFYKQNMWDSAAAHLAQALDNASNRQEKARWEYLLAQLYEQAGQYKEAGNYYNKSIVHTTDPVMAVYARLYSIRVNKDGGEHYIDKNIAELLKMARRDRFEDYRDIIYYTAAQMELERNNIAGAIQLLEKSTKYPNGDPSQRNKIFLQLAELSFTNKQYRRAYNFYDSIRLDDPSLKNPEAINTRKKQLGSIASNLEVIERQDSLQRIAGLPEDQRKDFVKKLVRQIRKQQGLKDENYSVSSPFANSNTNPASLFDNNSKGEWYFYNTASRSKGSNEFKTRWGNRPNVDNWRRGASISLSAQNNQTQINTPNNSSGNVSKGDSSRQSVTFDGLYNNLPLPTELLKASDDSIQTAMFYLGKSYIQDIEDCNAGTDTLESLRTRYPEFTPMEEVLFNLYYCYNKHGETAKAAAIKKLMADKYAGSNFTTIVTTGKNPEATKGKTEATKAYEKIYDLFIEGNFAEAIAKKKIADSLYSRNYWNPQLLYIEAVYYVKQKQDSVAIQKLKAITDQFPDHALANKAKTLIDVLGRRSQIEEELRNLVINRPKEDSVHRQNVTIIPPAQVKKDTVAITQPTVVQNPVVPAKPKVDTVVNKPTQVIAPPAPAAFNYDPNSAQYVVLVLNKVDPVFMNEAKNAFFRYNRETYYNKQYAIELSAIDDDNRLMLISPLKNADEALAYIAAAKPKTATEIIPWLKGGKYSYVIISERNLEILKANKNTSGYQTFINQQLPGKF